MKHVDYKALGSLPREHETLIPFKQLVNTFFSLRAAGRKSECHTIRKPPGGLRGEGRAVDKNSRGQEKNYPSVSY
jgi:hypothetical protein